MNSSTHRDSIRTYYAVFIGLLALTALTVAVAFVNLGGLNNIAALTIALTKAGVVVAFFMHVRHDTKLVKATIAVGCIWLTILIGLTLSDFLTRSW